MVTKQSQKSLVTILVNTCLRLLYVLIVVGLFAYFVHYIDSLVHNRPVESPLQLALVSTALGGFILLGAFYGDTPQQRLRLKKIAKLFLGAAIAFTVSYLLILVLHGMNPPSLGPIEWFLVVVTSIALGVAAFLFAAAVVYLLNLLLRFKL